MTIRIEELYNMDFSDVAEGEKLLPIHPGKILREEFLKPMNITPHALSLALQIPASRINDIVLERRAISVDTVRLDWRNTLATPRNSGWGYKPIMAWPSHAIPCATH